VCRVFRQQSLFAAFAILSLLFSPHATRADREAEATLKEFRAAEKAVQTMSADLTLTQSSGGGPVTTTPGSIRLKKPNFARIELGKPFHHTIASDGTSVWLTEKDRHRYQKNEANAQGTGMASFLIVPVGMFFDPEFRGFIEPSIQGTRYVGKETIEGQTYRVVEIQGDKPYHFTLTCYVDGRGLVTRTRLQMKLGADTLQFGTVLSHLKINETLSERDFSYTPPADAVLYDLSDPAGRLLPVGEKAYRFSVPAPVGNPLTLDGVLKGKKAVLINFWFYGCEPCRKEFPALQKLYDEFKDKGLEMVAVNSNDSSETIRNYITDNHFTFLVGMAKESTPQKESILQQYQVRVFPTSYILDARGTVLWRGVGFNEAEMRATLKKAGLQ
jgi:outer membrane lipoprotein-sorting protein/peroxiredoxin